MDLTANFWAAQYSRTVQVSPGKNRKAARLLTEVRLFAVKMTYKKTPLHTSLFSVLLLFTYPVREPASTLPPLAVFRKGRPRKTGLEGESRMEMRVRWLWRQVPLTICDLHPRNIGV